MKRASFLSSVFIAAILGPIASATIINIPDDYVTIQAGIDASTNGDTVLVQPGTYVENINFNGHNIVLGSLFLTTGDTSFIGQTVIDGDSAGSVVTFESGEDSTTMLTGFVIKNGYTEWRGGGIYCELANVTICNNIITENYVDWYGAGIYCDIYTKACLLKNKIYNNHAGLKGGGISVSHCTTSVVGNTIYNNYAPDEGGGVSGFYFRGSICNNVIYDNFSDEGGGLYLGHSSPKFTNNSIVFNTASGLGGGVYCTYGNLDIVNTIFWGNTIDGEVSEIFATHPSLATLSYCDVGGGWPGEGNINIAPLFRDHPVNSDFHLMAEECGDSYDSPCIDMGHPDLLDSLLDCDWGLGGLRSDMGAYGGGDSVGVNIDDLIKQLPKHIALFQNYPNPFNASTVIKYELPQQSQVTIEIYDILGRKVSTLIDKQQPAGYHQAIWYADDFASGMYFYKLQAGDYNNTKKMLLLK